MKCIFSSTFHLRIDNSKMNVKYRENIIRINSKEIEMKSKNILELKEVKNMLHMKHMLLLQQMDLHFRLVFMITKLQLGL